MVLACDAKELNPWLNLSANQCTKASSEFRCVDRLHAIKSDWLNFPFILTRHAIGRILIIAKNRRPIVWRARIKGKLNQSNLITIKPAMQQDSEEAFVH